MKRDMELCRKILFAIEEKYIDKALINLKIGEYSMEEVAYHCKLLHNGGFITSFDSKSSDNHIYLFVVGSLTWEGSEFLDKIRQDTTWEKTKEIINQKGLPLVLDVIKDVASSIISAMTEGAIKAMKN